MKRQRREAGREKELEQATRDYVASSEEKDNAESIDPAISQENKAKRIDSLTRKITSQEQAFKDAKTLADSKANESAGIYNYYCGEVKKAALATINTIDQLNKVINSDSSIVSSPQYSTLKTTCEDDAKTYLEKGKTRVFESIERRLTDEPPPQVHLVEALPTDHTVRMTAETKRIDLDRLHESIAKNDYGRPIIKDGVVMYDVVVEIKKFMKGGGEIRAHIHFHRPEIPPLSAERLLKDHKVDIVAMSYQTVEHAQMPKGSKKERAFFRKDHLETHILEHPALMLTQARGRGR